MKYFIALLLLASGTFIVFNFDAFVALNFLGSPVILDEEMSKWTTAIVCFVNFIIWVVIKPLVVELSQKIGLRLKWVTIAVLVTCGFIVTPILEMNERTLESRSVDLIAGLENYKQKNGSYPNNVNWIQMPLPYSCVLLHPMRYHHNSKAGTYELSVDQLYGWTKYYYSSGGYWIRMD